MTLIGGFCASRISGELAVSWGVVSVDTALVLLAAVVTLAALNVWQGRAATTADGHDALATAETRANHRAEREQPTLVTMTLAAPGCGSPPTTATEDAGRWRR